MLSVTRKLPKLGDSICRNFIFIPAYPSSYTEEGAGGGGREPSHLPPLTPGKRKTSTPICRYSICQEYDNTPLEWRSRMHLDTVLRSLPHNLPSIIIIINCRAGNCRASVHVHVPFPRFIQIRTAGNLFGHLRGLSEACVEF